MKVNAGFLTCMILPDQADKWSDRTDLLHSRVWVALVLIPAKDWRTSQGLYCLKCHRISQGWLSHLRAYPRVEL